MSERKYVFSVLLFDRLSSSEKIPLFVGTQQEFNVYAEGKKFKTMLMRLRACLKPNEFDLVRVQKQMVLKNGEVKFDATVISDFHRESS